jgi:hypothetical protein
MGDCIDRSNLVIRANVVRQVYSYDSRDINDDKRGIDVHTDGMLP